MFPSATTVRRLHARRPPAQLLNRNSWYGTNSVRIFPVTGIWQLPAADEAPTESAPISRAVLVSRQSVLA
jgi:hypothetical protein